MAAAHVTPAQVSAIAQRHGAPKWVGDALGATSVPESGGNPRAHNSRTNATGLLQVYPAAWPQLAAGGNLEDPDYNVQSALYILSQQGSSAWSGSGTWRGPAVHAGQFHFPKPVMGARAATAPTASSPGAATATPTVSGGDRGLFKDSQRSGALKALLWVVLVLGGTAISGIGASRAFGVHKPRLPVPA